MHLPETKPKISGRIPAISRQATVPSGFWHPWVQIALSIVLSAAAQVLLKLGTDAHKSDGVLGFLILRSVWGWLGIIAMTASLGSWLHALRSMPLNIAFNLAGAIHVVVPLSAWIFLGERIGVIRWCGILLVAAGVVVVARPLMNVEERL